MTTFEAKKILTEANKWRRGDEAVEMPDPKEFGLAIDVAVEVLQTVISN